MVQGTFYSRSTRHILIMRKTETVAESNRGKRETMRDTAAERKLELVQQIRSRYDEDMYDLNSRERILYGRESIRPREPYGNVPDDGEAPQSSFRLRFLLAVLLFAAVVTIDTNQAAPWGITAEKIYQVISADYEAKLEEWAGTLAK